MLSRKPFVKPADPEPFRDPLFHVKSDVDTKFIVAHTTVNDDNSVSNTIEEKNDKSVPFVDFPSVVIDKNLIDVFEVVMISLLTDKKIPKSVDLDINKDIVNICKKSVDKFCLVGGKLCFKVDDKDKQFNSGIRYYVNKNDRKAILDLAHNHPTSGHVGVSKTFDALKNKYFWPAMKKDVAEFISCCSVCQRNKHKPNFKSTLHPLEPTFVNGRWCTDIIIMPESASGNKYIITFLNAGSKFLSAFATSDQTASTVANKLFFDMMLIFGIPYELYHDQGKNFTADLTKELCALMGTTKTMSTVYHPQSNGQIERYNGYLINVLKTICSPDQSNWDKMLPFALFAINTHVPRGFKLSPYFLTFGIEPLTVVDLNLDFKPKNVTLREWYHNLVVARKAAAFWDEKVRWENAENFELNATSEPLPGDLVLVKFRVPPNKSKKLSLKHHGPFKVLEVVNGTAKLVNYFCKNDVIKRNIIHLTPYIHGEGEVLGDYEYEVEGVVDEAMIDNEKHYRIRWKGYGEENDSWRTEEDLVNCKEVLEKWKSRKKNSKGNSTTQDTSVAPQKTITVVRANDKKSNKVKTIPNIRIPKGAVVAEEVLDHKDMGKHYSFKIVLTEKDTQVEKWYKENMISNKDILAEYLSKNKLKDKSGVLMSFMK